MRLLKPAIILLLAIAIGHLFLKNMFYHPVDSVQYGVTFSPRYATYLKEDWQKLFISILEDLKVKNLRLPTYWNSIEIEEGKYDFSSIDFMLSQSTDKNAKVMLVLGERQPRWPECHIPKWATELNSSQRQQKILQLIERLIKRYEASPSVWAWQVENEPTLDSFGECDDADINFLKQEVKLVRSLSAKTIIITDSGELGSWIIPMQLSDIFGTSLYREVHHPYFGYITYPIPQYFYLLKSQIVKAIFAPNNQKTILVEVQAEPWLENGVLAQAADQQLKIFTLDKFRSTVEFAKKTGFDEIYLWGIEWWYWMAKQGHPEYLDYAKILF